MWTVRYVRHNNYAIIDDKKLLAFVFAVFVERRGTVHKNCSLLVQNLYYCEWSLLEYV